MKSFWDSSGGRPSSRVPPLPRRRREGRSLQGVVCPDLESAPRNRSDSLVEWIRARLAQPKMSRFVGRRDVKKNRVYIYALCVFFGFLMVFARTNQAGSVGRPQAQELYTRTKSVPTYENATCPSHYRTICDEYVCPKGGEICYHGKRESPAMSSSKEKQTLAVVQVNKEEHICYLTTEGEHEGLSEWGYSWVKLTKDDPFAYDPREQYYDRAIRVGMMEEKFDRFNEASGRGSEVTMNTLILGVGGGLAAHTIDRMAPKAKIDMVDLDPETIYAAKAWFCAPQREGIRYHVDDAYNFVKESRIKYDYTFVDIFQPVDEGTRKERKQHENPPIFQSESFFELLRRTTKDDGVAVMNMLVKSEAVRKENEILARKHWREVTFAPLMDPELMRERRKKMPKAVIEELDRQFLVTFKA